MFKNHILFLITILFLSSSCKKESQFDIDIKLIEEYLEENNIDAIKTNSGLHYVMIKEGNGSTSPNYNSTVEVVYKGTLLDGTLFDQTPSRTSSLIEMRFAVSGWQEGLGLMKRNGKAQFFMPSYLGYGNAPRGIIPQNSVLIFEVELIDF